MRRIIPLFLLADGASLLGNSFIAIVLPWLVLTRTGDPGAAGVVAAATALPALLAAFIGGWVVDRIGRRVASIVSDLGSALAVAAIPLVDALVGLDLGWFIALGVLGSLFDVPGMTARESLLPDVALAGGMPIERLSGVRETLFGLAFLLGPAAAGGALALFDPISVVFATAVTSAFAAACTAALPRAVGRRATLDDADDRAILGGLRVLRRDPLLLALTVLAIGSAAILGPLQGLLLPVYFVAIDTPAGLGLSLSALALGMLLGSVLYAVVGARIRRRTIFLLCIALTTVSLVLLAPLPHPFIVGIAMLVLGFGSGLLSPIVPVIVAARVPDALRGRVFGAQNAAMLLVAPLAIAGAGLLASADLAWAMWTAVGVWAALALYGLLVPGLRSLDDADDEVPSEVVA